MSTADVRNAESLILSSVRDSVIPKGSPVTNVVYLVRHGQTCFTGPLGEVVGRGRGCEAIGPLERGCL